MLYKYNYNEKYDYFGKNQKEKTVNKKYEKSNTSQNYKNI